MRVARAALHFWEEPPVSGDAGSGTVFFSGCPVHCVYCQNAQIATGAAGYETSVERLAEICWELREKGAWNINFVTPTHHSASIARAVALARAGGFDLPIVWNTSGYERVETIRALDGTVDVYLADFKYADADLAARYSHAPDYPQVALAALAEMAEQVGRPRYDKPPSGVMGASSSADVGDGADGSARLVKGVVVRHLLLPGALDASKRALRVVFERLGDEVLYSIMSQYTPVLSDKQAARFPELAHSVLREEYEELLDYADGLGIEDYFWQDGAAAEESFIPAWDGEGVLRAASSGERDAR